MMNDVALFLLQLNVKVGLVLAVGIAVAYCLNSYQAQLRKTVLNHSFILLSVFPLLLGVFVLTGLTIDVAIKPTVTEDVQQQKLHPNSPAGAGLQRDAANGIKESLTGGHQIPPNKITADVKKRLSVNWNLLLLSGYLVVALFLFVRLLAQYRKIYQNVRELPIIDSNKLQMEVAKLCSRLNIRQSITLRQNKANQTPYVWGVRKPIIVLPANFQTWSTSTQGNVLLHELVHVQKKDLFNGLLAKVCCCLYWPNPLVWKARTLFNLETEKACDESVVTKTVAAETYAEQLIAIAKQFQQPSRLVDALLPTMSRSSSLRARIDNILISSRRRVMHKKFKLLGGPGFDGAFTLCHRCKHPVAKSD